MTCRSSALGESDRNPSHNLHVHKIARYVRASIRDSNPAVTEDPFHSPRSLTFINVEAETIDLLRYSTSSMYLPYAPLARFGIASY